MKRLILLLALFFTAASLSFSQDIYEPEDEDDYFLSTSLNQKGDQHLRLGINLAYPFNPENLEIGGSGTLAYHHFINSWLTLGLEGNFGYMPTIGNNVFTYIPILFDIGIHPCLGRFEFPFTLGVGMGIENYLSMTYLGLVLKPQLAAFYRLNDNWSLGLQTAYMWMPQWFKDSEYNVNGNFLEIGLTMRYHF